MNFPFLVADDDVGRDVVSRRPEDRPLSLARARDASSSPGAPACRSAPSHLNVFWLHRPSPSCSIIADGRRLEAVSLAPVSAPASAATARGAAAGSAVARRAHSASTVRNAGPDRRLVSPVVRIETLGPLRQLVPVLGTARPAGDALQQLAVPWRGAGRPPPRPACGRAASGHRSTAAGRWAGGAHSRDAAARPAARAMADRGLARLVAAHDRGRPVESEIRVRMLQRLARLFVERAAPDPHMSGRSKQIQHARAARPLARAIARASHMWSRSHACRACSG